MKQVVACWLDVPSYRAMSLVAVASPPCEIPISAMLGRQLKGSDQIKVMGYDSQNSSSKMVCLPNVLERRSEEARSNVAPTA